MGRVNNQVVFILPRLRWLRRQTGAVPDQDPADVARLRDPRLAETDLPGHEDDRHQGRDTTTQQQNP